MTLYDTHAHFFTDDIETYPIDTSGAREGADVLRARILAHPSTPEAILELWDVNDVTGGSGVQYTSAYKTDNRYVLDSSDAYPERISAVVILDARDPDSPARLRELVTERGVAGLRLTGFAAEDGSWPWMNSAAALETWAEADRLGIAMVLMYLPKQPSASALEEIRQLAERFTNVNIVLDHAGWAATEGAPDYGLTPAHYALAPYPNVYFKFTTNNLYVLERHGLQADTFLRHLVDSFGADRIMWGSDYGNTDGEFADMAARARAAAALLTDQERQQVLHDTGEALFARRTNP
ncbi:amidohydrolase family protein [Parasphingopyxis marina]|uniref:amidohydrolase family protein n=1 Tax=Parasphingopyxis marina TaxID=2761622 RepID=UPI001C8D2A0A|nr:amidohydrolase family protein [Parasphingopyxis marina]